jgi:menaquinol-cytochrome c reductase iron-sulfur subunit
MSLHEPPTLKDEALEVVEGAAEAGQKQPYTAERRLFLQWLSLALGGAAAALVSIPIIGAILAPLLDAPPSVWHTVGTVEDFKVGTTVQVTFLNPSPEPWAGLVARNSAWLRRNSTTEFTAFAIYCQHLGCPVRWENGSQLFFCPCHGGAYYADGNVAAGPPQRPLQQYEVRVDRGRVQVLAGSIPVPQFPVPGTNEAPQ